MTSRLYENAPVKFYVKYSHSRSDHWSSNIISRIFEDEDGEEEDEDSEEDGEEDDE